MAFGRMHCTARMPEGVVGEGGRLYALPARALVDAARGMTSLREVRALIAGAVQQRYCPLRALVRELPQGRMRNSALLRQGLAEVADGIRSVAVAEFKDLISGAGLPEPVFNA